jgi:hypothetical protein
MINANMPSHHLLQHMSELLMQDSQRAARRESADRGLDVEAEGAAAPANRRAAPSAEESAQFLESIRAEEEQDDHSRTARDEAEADESLVVLAEIELAPPLQNLFAPAPIDQAVSTGAGTEALVDAVMRRMEAALRTEAAPAGERSFRLALTLDGDAPHSLKTLEVAISPQSIEVVLTRMDAGISANLLEAAGALAARLQYRFPGRAIRILNRAAGQESAAESVDEATGLRGIAHLFQDRG